MKIFFYAGLLLCMVVVANVSLWIITSTKEMSFTQAKALYLGYFPAFIRSAFVLTLLGITLNSLSTYLLTRSQRITDSGYRQVSQLVIILNIILISWQVFTLM